MAEIKLNCIGMQCPGPLMTLAKTLKQAQPGDEIIIQVTESSFARDVESYCKKTGNELVSLEKGDVITAKIRKK